MGDTTPSGFHFSHQAARIPLKKNQGLFLLKSLQGSTPPRVKPQSPQRAQRQDPSQSHPRLNPSLHSLSLLHWLCICLECLHPRTFALATHWDIFPAPSTQTLLTSQLCTMRLKHWPPQPLVSLPANLPARMSPPGRHRSLSVSFLPSCVPNTSGCSGLFLM